MALWALAEPTPRLSRTARLLAPAPASLYARHPASQIPRRGGCAQLAAKAPFVREFKRGSPAKTYRKFSTSCILKGKKQEILRTGGPRNDTVTLSKAKGLRL